MIARTSSGFFRVCKVPPRLVTSCKGVTIAVIDLQLCKTSPHWGTKPRQRPVASALRGCRGDRQGSEGLKGDPLFGLQAKAAASPLLYQHCEEIARAVRGCQAISHLGCKPMGQPPHCIGFLRHHQAGETSEGHSSQLLAGCPALVETPRVPSQSSAIPSSCSMLNSCWAPQGLNVNDGLRHAANTVQPHARIHIRIRHWMVRPESAWADWHCGYVRYWIWCVCHQVCHFSIPEQLVIEPVSKSILQNVIEMTHSMHFPSPLSSLI
jgi:hypothetical protein